MTVEFINESGLEFTDISSEEYRVYEYRDGAAFQITNPLKLHVSASGGHRIFDEDGLSYYIKPDWQAITWKAKPGKPHFVR